MDFFTGADTDNLCFNRAVTDQNVGDVRHLGGRYSRDIGLTTISCFDGFKNYIDYRIAGQYTKETVTTELGFWDTDREDLAGKDFKDSRVYIKVSKTF